MIELPASVNEWRAALASAKLPILAVTRQEVERLRRRPGLNASRLGEIARADAALGLQLLAAANRLARDAGSRSCEDGIQSISHGISLLGVDKTLAICLALPTVDKLSALPRRQGYCAALGKAQLAANLSERWLGSHEGARSTATRQFVAELLCWVATDEPAPMFSRLLDATAESRAALESQLLGTTFEELRTITLEGWHLEAQANASSTPVQQRRARIAALAARLSDALERSWHDERSTKLVEQLGDALQQTSDQVWASLRSTVAGTARRFGATEPLHMARTLPLIGHGTLSPVWYSDARADMEPQREAPSLKKAGVENSSRSRVVQRCAEVLKRYTGRQIGVHEALNTVTQSLAEGYRLDPVVMSTLSRDRHHLVARFCAPENAEVKRSFRIDLGQPSLFSRLLSKQQGLLVNRANCRKVWSELPQSCRRLLPESGFCLLSLFVRGKPIGLFYAGGFPDRDDQARACYEQFKAICYATGRAMETTAA